MMKNFIFSLIVLIAISSCKQKSDPVIFSKYDESSEIAEQQSHEISRMRFKLLQSKYLDMNEVFKPFDSELAYFSEQDYLNLLPYIEEKSIPSIQESVNNNILSYEKIALFYLYRIRKFESDTTLYLNSLIALNPSILEEAREKDMNKPAEVDVNSLYGLPILLKDNINTKGMPTTAGAAALIDNTTTDDAFIVKRLKENGALILGKVNLSEWAYFFCSGCPVGYSAIGGQTLNPYGRKIFETGGSSSGSGVSMAANFAVAAVGTETSGSILSPSSQNSIVGLKPTVGLLSRTGIVPISSTLDTPGPMTKYTIDNAILLQAMMGKDAEDTYMNESYEIKNYADELENAKLQGLRFGVLPNLLQDSTYSKSIDILKNNGAEIITIEPKNVSFRGFLTLLNIDMKNDLPSYLDNYADKNITVSSVKDVIEFNLQDTLKRAPYGQALFEGIVNDTTSTSNFSVIKNNLMQNGRMYFSVIDSLHLDAVLSINNYHAGYAAVAHYPCLTVPMGYKTSGEPIGLTFISKPYSEEALLKMGYAFEKSSNARKKPVSY